MIDDNVFATEAEKPGGENDFFATVAEVHEDGVTLIIDGAETEKHYMVNTGCRYQAGDTVKVLNIRGTYIVEYAVGLASVGADSNDDISEALEGSY